MGYIVLLVRPSRASEVWSMDFGRSVKCPTVFDDATQASVTIALARTVIEEWRWDYNEQRPKKDLGGVPPGRLRGAAKFASELSRKRIGYGLQRRKL